MRMTLNQFIAHLQLEAVENGNREIEAIDTIEMSNKTFAKGDKLQITDSLIQRSKRVTFNVRLAELKTGC